MHILVVKNGWIQEEKKLPRHFSRFGLPSHSITVPVGHGSAGRHTEYVVVEKEHRADIPDNFEVIREPNLCLRPTETSDDSRVLVLWKVQNCKGFEGTADILVQQTYPEYYREDDGCYDVSFVTNCACLAVFRIGDRLKTAPRDPRGLDPGIVFPGSHNWFKGRTWHMHYMQRGKVGKPYLSVRGRQIKPALS